jgi:hypothetical protein
LAEIWEFWIIIIFSFFGFLIFWFCFFIGVAAARGGRALGDGGVGGWLRCQKMRRELAVILVPVSWDMG